MANGPIRTIYLYRPSNMIVWLVVVGTVVLAGRRLIVTIAQSMPQPFGGLLAILTLALMAATFLAVIFIRGRRFFNTRAVQRDRDAFAAQLLPHLVAPGDEKANYSLFLRPFFTDQRFRLVHTSQSNPENVRYGATSSMEGSLAAAFDRTATLVAAGQRGSGLGPGRVVVPDDNWQWAIEQLVAHARYIVAVPISQPATAWEIGLLRQTGALSRTVFFVPPLKSTLRGLFKGAATRSLRDAYELSRADFAKEGMNLPAMQDCGGVFMLSPTGDRVVALQMLPEQRGLLPEHVAAVMDALLGGAQFRSNFADQSQPARPAQHTVWPASAPSGPTATSSFAPPRWWHWGHIQAAVGVGFLLLAVVLLWPLLSDYLARQALQQRQIASAERIINAVTNAEWSTAPASDLLQRLVQAEAAPGLEPLSKRNGETHAVMLLAAAHYFGLAGYARDPAEAVRLATIGADAGDPRAQVVLGIALDTGTGAPADRTRARGLFQRAADAGNAFGQYNLAAALDFQSDGSALDPLQAMRLYIAAANQGHAYAAGQGCRIKLLGLDGAASPSAARNYCARAAAAGSALGAHLYATFYRYGLAGVAQDYNEAARLEQVARDAVAASQR